MRNPLVKIQNHIFNFFERHTNERTDGQMDKRTDVQAHSYIPLQLFQRCGLNKESLEGFSGIQGYWPKLKGIQDIFHKYLKRYGILGSILGIWEYNAF